MAVVNKCDNCGTIYDGDTCPNCKEKLEREHSAKMNEEAVERIKKEMLTEEEARQVEAIFFEDDEELRLRDGKKYRIVPCSLKKARRLMQLLKTVNIEVIVMNFIPSNSAELDKQREDELFEILMMAFTNYPSINREYLEEHVDINLAKKIINVLIGLNGLKK